MKRSVKKLFLLLIVFAGLSVGLSAEDLSFTKNIRKQNYRKIGSGLARIIAIRNENGISGAYLEARNMGINVEKQLLRREKETFIPLVLRLEGVVNMEQITALGGIVDARSRSYIRVLAPVKELEKYDRLEGVKSIDLPLHPVAHGGLGPKESEAVTLTGADQLQAQGITGAGIKVAVIDLGFIGWRDRISEGELPSNAVSVDFSGSGFESNTEHGTGVAEHVMDMAPGATLYGIKVGDEVDLENAADYCYTHNILIANHSVGWVNSSYYDGTGPISGIVDDSTAAGTFWTVSAGNSALRHWKGSWYDPNGNDILNWTINDENNSLSGTYGVVQVFLNWNQYGNSVTDLDLYIMDKWGWEAASSTGYQSGSQDPAEAVAFSYNSSRAPYTVMVNRYSGPVGNLDLTLFSFTHNFEYQVNGYSLSDPATADSAYSVSAVDYVNFSYGGPLESFSSYGPRNDGEDKVEIAAPDGTTSKTYGDSGSYGTSFASPTTAGAAALLAQKYNLTTPAAIRAKLDDLAVDAGAPGYDYLYGAGLLHVE